MLPWAASILDYIYPCSRGSALSTSSMKSVPLDRRCESFVTMRVIIVRRVLQKEAILLVGEEYIPYLNDNGKNMLPVSKHNRCR
jgi:hypothetical protein